MREIKFRAWDSVNLKMWFPASFKSGIGVNVPNEYLTHTETDIFLNCRSNGVVFQQYTGLKDKNGVEIYEGDIINHNDFIGYVKYINKGNCNVLGYALVSLLDNRVFYMYCDETDNYEIIGNIYENKELLK